MSHRSGLINILQHHARQTPDRLAFVFLDERGRQRKQLTYRELDDSCRQRAGELAERGMAERRVAVFSRTNSDEFLIDFLSCIYAGAIAVPLHAPNPNSRFDRLVSLLNNADPAMLLGTEEDSELAHLLTGNVSNDGGVPNTHLRSADVAMIQYTSGSTSQPRGVVVSHDNLMQNQRMICESFGHNQETVVVGWLPLFHDMGLIGNVMQPIYLGATAVLMSPMTFLMRPKLWLIAISEYGGTTSGGPDFCYRHCVQKLSAEDLSGIDLSSWRVAFNGSEPVRAQTMTQFAKTFARCGFRHEAFFPCYGLAEATLFVSGGHCSRAESGFASCGHWRTGTNIRIVDPCTHRRLPDTQVGEIWISSPCVAAGYWGENRSETFNGYIAETGEGPFLRTGDLGFVSDGQLYIAGRLKDSWIIAGANYYPEDIEYSIERAIPSIRPGRICAFMTEETRIVVVCEVVDRRLQRHASLVLSGNIIEAVSREHSLRVADVVFLEPGGLPTTSSGKIRRGACRDSYIAEHLNRHRFGE